ncbi:MAG: ferrous iron transport protein A [Rhodospirillales bacterium]|nr:ferrous iron transport protein A [Rhodospirillales bacterium]
MSTPEIDGALGLGDLVVGDRGRITGLRRGDRSYREKLLSMGLTPGTEFSVTRLAPLGDPVEIAVRGFAISLRKGEAQLLRVERL